MSLRAIGLTVCLFVIGTIQGWSASADENEKSEIKGGIAGKIVKVDVEQATVTIAREDGRERTFTITNDTTIVGPRGGVVHRRLRDSRFHKGLSVTIVASGETATEVHLGYDRKARRGGSSSASSSEQTTPPVVGTRRTAQFRGIPSTRPGTAKEEPKTEETDA